MAASLNLVVIRVSDLERAKRFYEALGLRLTRERHGSGPEHLAVDLNGVVFEIYPRGDGPSTVGVRLGFQVASVVSSIDAVERLVAQFLAPPKEGPYGIRATIVDPDGHRVEISQSI